VLVDVSRLGYGRRNVANDANICRDRNQHVARLKLRAHSLTRTLIQLDEAKILQIRINRVARKICNTDERRTSVRIEHRPTARSARDKGVQFAGLNHHPICRNNTNFRPLVSNRGDVVLQHSQPGIARAGLPHLHAKPIRSRCASTLACNSATRSTSSGNRAS